MKFFSSFSIAVTALLSHKTRTLLASLGILIGIASVIVMVAIGKGSQQEVMDVIAGMGENMVTINAGEMKRRGGRLRLSGNVITLTPKDAERIVDEIGEVSSLYIRKKYEESYKYSEKLKEKIQKLTAYLLFEWLEFQNSYQKMVLMYYVKEKKQGHILILHQS